MTELSEFITSLAVMKKNLQQPETSDFVQRWQWLKQLSEVWGQIEDAELSALAAESGLHSELVQSWDLRGGREFLANWLEQHRSPASLDKVELFPRGVIALLQPRYHGLRVLLERLAPALVAGNSVLIKMSSHNPTATQVLARWFAAAKIGMPDVYLMTSDRHQLGPYLLGHPAIAAVSAVGQRETMMQIHSQVVSSGKSFQGWCGGRATAAVLALLTADQWYDLLREPLLMGRGQRCYDLLRFFVLERHEQEQRRAVELAISRLRDEGAADSTLRFEGSQCSEDHLREAMGPVVLMSVVKYPFEIAKWINSAETGFAARLIGDREISCKIASKIEVGAVFIERSFDPKESILFGVKGSILGQVDSKPEGSFFSQQRKIFD